MSPLRLCAFARKLNLVHRELLGIRDLIDQKQYFVIHAARQSGKTTLLLDLANRLNSEGRYHALYCSMESLQRIDDPKEGIPAIVREIANEIEIHADLDKSLFLENADQDDYTAVLRMSFSRFCQSPDFFPLR